MKTSAETRPPRAERPAAPQLPEFESLDHAHRAALQMLESFERLIDRLEDGGPDEATQADARQILEFFSGPGAHHHADEEKHVFPGLLASKNADLIQHVRRLQQDHRWIEEDWRELHPQIEAIANGYNWFDMAMLRQALPVFGALYRDHITLEETLIYPAARRQREALAQGQRERSATSATSAT